MKCGTRIVMLAVLTTSSVVQAQIVNGGFEADPAGLPGDPVTGWQNFNFAFTSVEYARTGAKSLKTYGPFFSGGGSVAIQDFTPTAGQPLTVRGYGLTPSGDRVTGSNFGLLKLEFFNASNLSLGAVEQRVDINSTPNVWNLLTLQSTVPAGTTRASLVAGHIQLGNPATGGAVFFDDIEIVAAPTTPTWAANASGDYYNPSNWQAGSIANGVGAGAIFGSAITAARTVYADQPVTLGTLNFDNANRYLLAGNGSLTMDASSGSAAINVASGSHKINLPLTLVDNTNANVATGTTLVIADPMTLANGSQLNASGGGTVQIISTVTTTGGASINASAGARVQAEMNLNGASVNVNGGQAAFAASQNLTGLSVTNGTASIDDTAELHVVRTGSLTVGTGGKLDVNDNGLILDYSGASPIASVTASVASAYAGGLWTGSGITSSVAASNSSTGVGVIQAADLATPGTFLGQTVDATTVVARLTLRGDSDLNGGVDFQDLLRLAQSYDQSGTWARGDSDYNGLVQFPDLLALAQNYGGSLLIADSLVANSGLSEQFLSDFRLARSIVPEPASALMIFVAASLMSTRRRR
jgi:hypothetical protein